MPVETSNPTESQGQRGDVASPPVECETPDAQHKVRGTQREIGGRGGADPTRFGDWEKAGRCIDF